MKVIFYRARSYWKDGENSTWELHSNFDKDFLYQKLKEEQDTVRDTQKSYISFEDDTLFLFYRDGGKDFSGRDYIEIVALRSVKKFKNKNAVHEVLTSKIQDVFDDFFEYEVEIDDSYIVKDANNDVVSNDESMFTKGKKYILFFSILLSLFYIFILFDDASLESNKLNKSVKEEVIKVVALKRNNKLDKQESDKKKTEQKSWKWKEFCSKYTVDEPKYCYQKYIVEKCEKKDNFSYNYKDFFAYKQEKEDEDNMSFLCEDIKEIEEDSNLKESSSWIDSKLFFKE